MSAKKSKFTFRMEVEDKNQGKTIVDDFVFLLPEGMKKEDMEKRAKVTYQLRLDEIFGSNRSVTVKKAELV